MTLPAPNLDDRGFQDLVDEAKRLVQLRNPAWTDHNVADPGVTLIETFASMVDQLIYRLNRVPDLHYVKFLELLGEQMIPPGAAMTELSFSLTVPQEIDCVIPAGTLVSTPRTTPAPPITFATQEELVIPSIAVDRLFTKRLDGGFESHAEERALRRTFAAFSDVPVTGDAIYIALTQPTPRCVVRLTFSRGETIEGIGVDPRRPPYVVEAWDGTAWAPARILTDTTGGLNRDGIIEARIGAHASSRIAGVDAAWLRIAVVDPVPGQPEYVVSPAVADISAATVGGTVAAQHCDPVLDELAGPCSGTPGDRIALTRSPLIAGQEDLVIEVSEPGGWRTWHRVESFADSGPTDRHFTIDDVGAEVRFGPSIRMPDGSVRLHGATPPAQAMIRVPRYLVGGGAAGNVDAGTLTVLRSSIPYVGSVTNLRAATGGTDAETIEDVKQRAAITVRTQMRAVTARDYELLVQLGVPSIARVSCVDAATLGRPGHVLVQVVPSVPADVRDFSLLQPTDEVMTAIRDYLEPRRPLGAVVHIEPPRYLGASVAARFVLEPGASAIATTEAADAAIRAYVHPLTGGLEGRGWPFGQPLLVGDIHAIVQRVPGVAYVEVVRLIPVDVVSGARGVPGDVIQPGARELIFCVGNELEARP